MNQLNSMQRSHTTKLEYVVLFILPPLNAYHSLLKTGRLQGLVFLIMQYLQITVEL